MGFEMRKGRPYLYKKVRVGQKVVSVYKGGGPMAPIFAALEAEDALAKKRAIENFQAWELSEAAALKQVMDFCEHVNSVVTAALEAEGFHRPFRGPWRRQRASGHRDRRGPVSDDPNASLYPR